MNKRVTIKDPAAATPAKPTGASAYAVIEPRIMLDANLSWTIDASDSLTDALQGVTKMLDADFGAFDTFVDNFETTLDALAPALDPLLGDDDSTLDFLSKTVAALRESAEALKAGADVILDDVIGAGFHSTLATQMDAWVDATSTGSTAQKTALKDQITTAQMLTNFGKDDFRAGTISTNADSFVASLNANLVANGLTQAGAKAQLLLLIEAGLGGTTDQTLEFTLVDALIGPNAITYSDGTNADEVDVEIGLPGLGLNLTALFGAAFDNATLPLDFSVLAIDSSLTFTLKSTVSAAAVGINAIDFDLSNLVTVGGDLVPGGASLNLGLLDLAVDTAETAQVALGITTDAAMTLRTSAALTPGFTVAATTTNAALTGSLTINEAGGADTFVNLLADTDYTLLALGLSGSTGFVTGVNDTNAADDAKAFTAALTVSGVVNASTASTPKERITAFLASAGAGFDVDLSGSVSNASQRAGMELALENLAVLGAEEVLQFITDLGAATQGILTDAAFDVSVPFTDINLNVAAQAIADIFASLPSSFLIDPVQLGFATGAPGALVEVEATFTQSGAAMTTEQIQALRTIGIAEFRIATGGTPDHVAVNLDLTDNAVMLDAGSSDAAILAELVRLLNVVIKVYGMAASVVGNALTFNARYPGNDPSNPLPTLSLVGVRERGVNATDRSDDVANDTFSLANLGFAPGSLDADADGLSTGGDDTLGSGAETTVKFAQRAGIEALIGPFFAQDTDGLDAISLVVTVAGFSNTVDVQKPAGGWLLAGGTADIDSILTSLNTALASANAVATINFDRTGFVVVPTVPGQEISLEVEPLAPLSSPISAALNQRTADVLMPDDIAALKTYSSLDLRVLTGAVDSEGDAVVVDVTVNLATGATNTVLTDPAATDAQILAAVAAAMDTALAAYQIDVAIVDGAFRITSAYPGGDSTNTPRTFGIIGADLRSNGSFVDDFSLESLGFGAGALDAPVDYDLSTAPGDGGDGEEYVLSFFGTATQTLVFGPKFAEAMIGVDELLFTVAVGGADHSVRIAEPVTGWVLAGNAPNYAGIAAAFNAAFAEAGFALQASVAGGGLTFRVPAGTDQLYTFGIEPGKMVRALSLDGLLDWVNVELNKVEVLEGSKLMLTEAGELLFQFPEITRSASISSSSQLSGLQLDQLGLGQLENVDLSANLDATVTASLDMVAGIDLVGLGLGLLDDTREDIGDLVFDNTFLRDVDFVVDLTGTATNVTGTAEMGLLKVDIGADDPSLNFLALNVQLNVGVVGEDASGNKTTQVSMTNIQDAFNQSRVTDLIGRYDLQGGILTEDGANAYDTMGNRATIATLQIVDPASAVLGADEALVMLFATLGDIRIDVGTLTGLNEDLIDGINIAIGDGLDPLNTFAVAVYSNDADAQEAIDGLSALEDGDILDTLSAIGKTLQVVGDKLKDDLPFLDEDLPLFNFSLLDGVDFATEFVDKLREVRDNPQAMLDEIEEFLESIFGADTVELAWVAAEKTITIEMEFGFLREYQEERPFSLDLDQLLAGNFSGQGIDAQVAELISGIADVSGDGTLVFDPDLTLRMKFGIDLRPTLDPSTVIAAPELELFQLVSGSIVTVNASGDDDLEIIWTDATDPDDVISHTVRVDVDGLNTLGEIVDAINAALVDEVGSPASDTISFSYDETTGTITFVDTEGFKLDTTGVEALFGLEEVTSSGDPRVIDLDAGFTDFAGAHSFDLVLGADGEGWPVTVTLAADSARDTAAEFAAALNAAFATLSVSRDVLSDIAGPVLEVRVSQLIKAEVVAGTLRLVETNFADALGYDSRDFAVRGIDVSDDIFLQIQSLGESNIASVLGFGGVEGQEIKGRITSDVLYEDTGIGAPRVYLDTDRSAVFAEIKAGVESSLNITIGIGPLEVNVVNGTALLTDGKGSSDPARFGFSFIDIDGDAFDEQYDLRDLNALFNDDNRQVLDLIQMDVAVGLLVDLPLSDSLGIFDPATDGIGYSADLLLSIDGQSLGDFDLSQIETHFEGDLIALYLGEAVDPDNLELRLPELGELFENFNYLAFLNDPRAVLSALDTILNQMQSLFDDYLADIELPVIGDKIGAGVTFFDDFRYKVLEQIRIKAETPDPVTGKLPTTVDLLTNEVNALMNDLFDTTGVVYMQARLDTSGTTSESYLLASLNFNGIIFDEDLAVDFEFGVPGLDLEVTDGSKLRMTLDYLVNIGFGIDKNGFFLLNDTDRAEVGITFTVDAGTFEGSAKVLGVLGLEATAVTLDDDGNVTSTDEGVAYVSATLGAALFGDDEGLEIIDSGTAGDGEIVRDFGDIALEDALGNELTFERLIYFNQIDYGNLITFEFGANFELQISLSGSVLDPTTGGPIRIGGVSILPTVATEFWVAGSYTYGDGLNIDQLSFENVRLNAQELYEAVLKPILDPIMEVVNPLADFFRWTQETPFKEALSIAGAAFPIIGIANTVITIGIQVTDMVNLFAATGGILIFGDYDFTDRADAIVSGETTMSESSSSVKVTKTSRSSATPGTQANPFGVFGNIQQGISIEVPLLSQPSNILDLILGNYDQVDLAIVHMNLFNFDTGKIDLVDEILAGVGIPGWVGSIVERFFQAEISLKFKAGFSAGYDLGGIVNFVNTLDAVRLLDGVFIDSAPGSLVDAEVWGRFSLNAGIAGASGEVGAGVKISFNDPNNDGKLRIPELIALVEAAADALAEGDIGEALGLIFVGEAYYKAKLSIWAGINLPWPLPDLKWSTTVFDFGDTIPFGGNPVPARIVTDLDAGETAFLNIGSRGGDSMTKITGDGDDRLVLTGGGSGNYSAAYSQGAKTFNGSFANSGTALVMQAGEGNNVIDLSGASGALPTVTYTGGDVDTIILPTSGLHVVFAGAGNDTIRTNSTSTGTYIIFGQDGSDTIDIKGGNVIYFGDDDFGARDLFLAEFALGGVTDAAIRAFFGIDANGIPQAGATQTNFSINGEATNLHGLLSSFTIDTQLSASKAADRVTLGSGNHVVLTGAGADQILVNGNAGVGTMTILSGDGNDRVEVTNGGSVFVEAGAGGDRVYVNATSSTIWGYGAAAGLDGLIGTEAATAIDALAVRDSMDILIGGLGADAIFGQLGSDFIEGGDGSDTINGGIGDDIMVGGTMVLADKNGTPIVLRNLIPDAPLQNGLCIANEDRADGNDDITGAAGLDVILGGGGNDTLRGDSGGDVILGDFGKVLLSSNLVAQSVATLFDTSANNGTDVITGGLGGDVLIAGGGIVGQTESVTDLDGSNVVLGDFGKAEGARLLDAVSNVESFASASGSSDSITTGRGNDILIGGEGNDTIRAGSGGDIVIGDLGKVNPGNTLVESMVSAASGDDSIATDATDNVFDIVIGGGGSDRITGGLGGMVVLGDDGRLTLDSVALSLLLTYEPPSETATAEELEADAERRERITGLARLVEGVVDDSSGNDSLTIDGGKLIAVMGGGDDEVSNSNAADVVYVLGDNGTITIETTGDTTETVLQSEADATDGSDTITSGTGNDWIIAGGAGDSVDAGDGDDVVLGDFGSYDGTTATSTQTTDDRGDTITAGLGNDIVIAGGDADSVDGGDGDNVILGDSGSFDGEELISALQDGDGNDTVTSGTGNDWVILGQGDDEANLGAGDNRVLGDSGKITASLVTSTENANGGQDSITTGAGNDIVIAGSGNDTVDAGNGNNFVLGDAGTRDDTAGTLTSERTLGDGVDDLTTGTGNDWVFGGGNTDLIDAGAGDNVVLGDSGTHDGTTLNSVRTVGDASDTITTGGGNDMIIAGGDADSITAGDGENVIASDSGSFDGMELISALNEGDGNDTVTAGTGNDWVILGQGDEIADLGAGDNRILGDSGKITAMLVTSTENANGGQDSITTGAGNDIVIAGSGNDTVDAGNGNNFVLGDAGTRDDTAGTLTSERTLGDGVDDLTSGTGNDWVFGGGNTDSIAAGDGDNRILGDSGSFDGFDLISPLDEGDASDTVTSGAGNDWVILGQGDDEANLGNGNNQVLGDSGLIRALQAYSTSNDDGGADDITTGTGNDVVIAGSGNDTVAAGDGDNVILGDTGELDRTVWSLFSEPGKGDGDDSVTSGSGNDWAILGQGNDFADLGEGNNRAIGDSGEIIDAAKLTLDTTFIDLGGMDTIRTGGGNDILLGGANSDLIYGGNGDNTALGDNGNVTYDPAITSGMTSVTTEISTAGAPDTIETGDGRDVIVGGEGGDRILSGAGSDLVMGDQGSVTGSATDLFGTLTSLIDEVPGDDHIELGSGNDVAIAGLGNDSVYAGQGEDMVLGDSGFIAYSSLASIEEIVLEDQDRGGDDYITAAGVGGDNILIGQFGSDTIEGGTDDDVILGDFALFTFLPGEDGFTGQSSADRMQRMQAIRVDLEFNDSLVGDSGSDFMMGGMGDDLMYGNDGQDIMIGDMVIFVRTWTAQAGNMVFEETTLDTNFAYITGGYDEFYSGDGPDIMIGGLGPDLFFGNTEFDLIYSDAYAGLFNATWVDGFTGATPQRFLIKSNFAGPGAIDVVSEAQQDSSIGGPLDLRAEGEAYETTFGDVSGKRLTAILAGGGGIQELSYLVIDLLGSYDIIKKISALVLDGLDPDVLVEALRNEVIQNLLSMDLTNLIASEVMIERIIRLYLAQAGLLPEADPAEAGGTSNGSDAAGLPWKIAAE